MLKLQNAARIRVLHRTLRAGNGPRRSRIKVSVRPQPRNRKEILIERFSAYEGPEFPGLFSESGRFAARRN